MKKLSLLFVAILSLSSICSAQKPRLYSSENGLFSSQVTSLFQDKAGYIWIATQDGAARFDGMEFHSYKGDSVMNIFEDSNGTLWEGTATGLLYFDVKSGTFRKFDLKEDGVPDSSIYITDIEEVTDAEGKEELIVSTSSHGVYIMDVRTHELKDEVSEMLNRKLGSLFISSCYVDSRGWVWFSFEDGGMTVIDYKTEEKPAVTISGADSRDIQISSFAEDPLNGNVAIATYNMGVLTYERRSGELRAAEETKGLSIRYIIFNDLLSSQKRHTFILGTEGQGYQLYDDESGRICNGDLPETDIYTTSWTVHSMMVDRQGNLWVGGYQKGLMIIPKSMYGFRNLSFSIRGLKGENTSCVTSIFKDSATGKLWVGTDGAGVFVHDDKGNTVNYNESNSPLTTNSITTIEKDSRGTIWIGTFLGGIFTWSTTTGLIPCKDNQRLPGNRFKVLAFNPADKQMYAGTSGNGMAVLSEDGLLVRSFCEDDYRWISAIKIGRNGAVWVGTYNGLMRLDRTEWKMERIEFDQDVRTPRIYALEEDDKGNVWCGTSEGAICYNPESKSTIKYTNANGTELYSIKDILHSDERIWTASNNGVYCIDVDGHINGYYANDGLQSNEFHTGAAFRDNNGILYFGGSNGITYFDPRSVIGGSHAIPNIHFPRLTVMDKTSLIGHGSIYIPNKSNLFSVEFSVPEFTNPGKVRYMYKLEGFDNDWHRTTHLSRSATYTNIPNGRYTLKARAFFEGNESHYSEREIPVFVEAPWYLKWWAILSYAAILGLAVLFFIRIYNNRKKAEQTKKEAAIKELRLGMFTNMTHEIRTPLSLVMNPLKRLREEETDPAQKGTYNLMYRNCLRINRIVNQLLDLRKVDEGQMKLHFVKTNIISFIKDIMRSFDELASSGNISFTLESANDPEYLWIDNGNFDKIIFNVLSNAFKFTPQNGRIDIAVKRTKEDKVVISIFNSGSSIDEKYIDRIFDRFFQLDSSPSTNGSGVGLNLTKKLVELHHGEISAANVEGGVTFTISLPCGCAHLSEEELAPTQHHKDLYNISKEEVTPTISITPNKDKMLKTKKNIVIVEDDAEALEYLRRELSSRFSVNGFVSGSEAWKNICQSIPDAVVTDLIMPGMSGLDLCSKIKHNPTTNHIPVIILTSQSDDETQRQCSEAGADRFFTKPAPLDVFESVIQQTISAREILKGKYTNKADYEYEKVRMPFDNSKLYEKIVDIIKSHLDDSSFSVEDLSRELGMSRVHLNRKLKELGSVAPSMLMKSIRLKQAAYLLVNSKVNVSEVAYRVGFTSHSYFTKAFHGFFGLTPKEFVAKYENGANAEEFRKLIE